MNFIDNYVKADLINITIAISLLVAIGYIFWRILW